MNKNVYAVVSAEISKNNSHTGVFIEGIFYTRERAAKYLNVKFETELREHKETFPCIKWKTKKQITNRKKLGILEYYEICPAKTNSDITATCFWIECIFLMQ